MRIAIFLLLSAAFLVSKAQRLDSNYNILLEDFGSGQAIAYAHISQGEKLIAITDFFGNAQFHTKDLSTALSITYVGYEKKTLQVDALKFNKKNIIRLVPDQQILEAVIIKPNALEDMIATVYKNIPKAYLQLPHLLSGILEERYMDTIGHANITSSANIFVQKQGYEKQHKKGEVKIDSLTRAYNVTSTPYAQIYAGAHIPHRFDFVMKREEFINPSSFNKYQYTYRGEWESGGRILDIISFEPNSGGLLGGQFRGKIYLDMNEKVFLKAEYQYTKSGFLSNAESRWADQRMFITEYKKNKDGWYFSYTWDEAVRYEDNFLLSQYFMTERVVSDTLANWNYDEKIHFQDVMENEVADSLIVIQGEADTDYKEIEYIRESPLLKFLLKFESGLGTKVYSLLNRRINAGALLTYNDQSLTIDENFSTPLVDFGLAAIIRYPIHPNLYIQLGQAESFSRKIKLGNWDLGLSYRLPFKSSRPSSLNLNLSYAEFLSRFRFDKQAGVEPYFQQKNLGVLGGVSYEIRLNPKWKLNFGYNYFHPMVSKEKFYLKEKYGLFNLFSKKHDYPADLVQWEMNEETQMGPVNILNNHTVDISLIMALE